MISIDSGISSFPFGACLQSFSVPVTWITDSRFRLSRSSNISGAVFPFTPVTCILPVLSFRIKNRTFFRSRVSWTQPFRRTLFSDLNASLISVLCILRGEVLGL